MRDVLMYDCGYQIVDTHGTVYVKRSFLNYDIFYQEKALMQSAYYAKKIPMYEEELQSGYRKMLDTFGIKKRMLLDIENYNIKHVAAFNARFDVNGLNVTQRYVSDSRHRYFLPKGIIIWDIMKMASDTICKRKSYRKFCYDNNILTSRALPKKTVQAIWCYLTNNPEFQESHTGLEDVEIESKIMIHCLRQHKKMRKELYKEQFVFEEPTELQKRIWENLREPVRGFSKIKTEERRFEEIEVPLL